jgi:hypothetical protein
MQVGHFHLWKTRKLVSMATLASHSWGRTRQADSTVRAGILGSGHTFADAAAGARFWMFRRLRLAPSLAELRLELLNGLHQALQLLKG